MLISSPRSVHTIFTQNIFTRVSSHNAYIFHKVSSHKITSPGSVHTMLIILSSPRSVNMMPTSSPRSLAHHGAGVFRSWMALTECFWTPRAVGQESLPRILPSRCPRSVLVLLKVMSPLSCALGVRCREMHCICCSFCRTARLCCCCERKRRLW